MQPFWNCFLSIIDPTPFSLNIDNPRGLIWEGPASQPQSTLSRCKNLPTLLKNSDPPTPPKLGPIKTVLIVALKIALTLDVKIECFCHQMAVCVQKRHKNAIF